MLLHFKTYVYANAFSLQKISVVKCTNSLQIYSLCSNCAG